MKKYDAIVIGSGQGGNPLAFAMADRGWKVALIEKGNLGGTCVNTGCTPTKTMIASAQVAHYARHASQWGVRASEVSVDLAAVVARKRQIVEKSRGGVQKRVDQRPNLDLYKAEARFLDAHRVAVVDDTIEGERIFIDCGTRPGIPKIPGIEQSGYLTNATAMDLTEVPEHLIVLGGGYIGVEFGQMFRRFGSRVTVIHKGPQLLTREDPDIIAELQKALEEEGIEFCLNANTKQIARRNGCIAA
ncbi:MAG: FAD-dependent oxidoreductase, partial [Candidatus Acidiferrales bacterium]